ncbi:MAG TPA: tetratricopeptide repeat protein [Planktothrix sp.]|jgi:tetratricopeptide (TPR) repeat protein
MQTFKLRTTGRAVAAAALTVCLSTPAFAFLGFSSGLTDLQKKALQALKKPSDEPTLELVEQIAHQPELMNFRYLQYVIGPPSNEGNQIGAIKHYYWDDPNQQGLVKYELEQRESSPGQIFDSKFKALMPNLDKVDLPSLETKYGIGGSKKYFDQQANPNLQYSFAPDTKVTFKQPQDLFHVSEATVAYSGDSLPPLSAVSLSQAQQIRRTKALDSHKNEEWKKAIPALRNHVLENPDDAEARIALAEAYKNNSQLNEAIDQYRAALAHTQDPQVAQQCIQGLQGLHVLPQSGETFQQHDMEFTHKGQRLRINSENSSSPQDASQIYNNSQLNVQRQDPTSLLPNYDSTVGF